jgi:hypothetical protein
MDILQEIKQLKADVMNNPETNADYVKGYASAMSTVEGMIAAVEDKPPRLIDAEHLIKELKKRIRTPRSTMEIARDIIPLVKSQPTAYDVGKVIKQLESFEYGCIPPYRGTGECPQDRTCGECKTDYVIGLVKRGGING